MANKKFKDNNTLDSSQVYDNNKNDTLDNIVSTIPTKTSQITNDSGYVTTSTLFYNYSVSDVSNAIEWFKNWCISANVPIGVSLWSLGLNGAISAAIVQKANSSYLSFIHFGYGIQAVQYRYLNGTWYTDSLV